MPRLVGGRAGTCSRCGRATSKHLLRRLRGRDRYGDAIEFYVCPECDRGPQVRGPASPAGAIPAIPTAAMRSFKNGAGRRGDPPPGSPREPSVPLRRPRWPACDAIGCGRAATFGLGERHYCTAHRAFGSLPVEIGGRGT